MRSLSLILPLLFGLLAASPASPAELISSTFADLPLEVVEGQDVGITVNYDVAPALGEVQLRIELKNDREVVLAGGSFPVSGRGSAHYAFPAPPRAQESRLKFAVWYGPVWTEAIVPIIETNWVPVLSTTEAQRIRDDQAAADRWDASVRDAGLQLPVAAVLSDDLPGLDPAFAARVVERFRAAALPVVSLSGDEVCNRAILDPARINALVLPDLSAYPQDGGPALERFLLRGGNVVLLGATPFDTGVRRINGQWMGQAQVNAALAAQRPQTLLYDFDADDPADWSTTQGPGEPGTFEFAPGRPGQGRALHAVIPQYASWNTYIAPALTQAPPAGQTLTCLWARGTSRTSRLALEWVEKDGSRWIATIPLTDQWQHYALDPGQFRYWQDSASQGRGLPGDQLNLRNADRFTVGLAQTHTQLEGGRHEFWVDDIGFAANPLGNDLTLGPVAIPAVDMLTPSYKFHAVTNALKLQVSDKQCLLPAAQLPVPAGLMSVHPRPQGTGYDKDRKWRWIPLLEAFDREGEVCGTPACLLINRAAPWTGACIAAFTLPRDAFTDPVLDMVATIAARIRQGQFLFEGGSRFYAYFQGEDVTLGARTINLGGAPVPSGSVRFFITSPVGTELERTVPLVEGRAECRWAPGQFAGSDYTVACTLLDDQGRPVDMLTHPLVVWQPSANPAFMTVRNGEFMLRNRRWVAHGVNYMPSSGIGIEDGPYFEYWFDSQPYDPVVIERDLRRVKAMGMNMISIFCYYRSLESRNLLDTLERCRRLGLHVNLSLRPGTPLDFRWEEMKALIEAYRIAENDTVFAYDLAWEPQFGNHSMVKRWNAEWEHWIIERYGSLANAEADWGVPVPREDDGSVTVPFDAQLADNGAPRVMVCAYRRFLDDLLAKKHAIANNLIKSVDPNHFTSFRMSEAGNPTVGPTWIAYDFRGLARSVDIMEPEGYGRIGDWDRVKPGRFTVDYARCMAPGRPVMWAEFGNSIWDMSRMISDPGRETWTGGYYRDFYRMADEAGANGTVAWWYPGGFRVGENSDYGIINPDGSWRSISQAIRDNASRMTASRAPRRPDVWLTVDRDLTSGGLSGVYEKLAKPYWDAIAAGKTPGLRREGYSYTSANAPAIAVGNVPYKPGRNPHKFLNAEFDSVQIRNAQGRWQPVSDGDTVTVARGEVVVFRLTVGNNGDARWLAMGEDVADGQVRLTCGEASIELPHDVPYMGTARIEDFATLNGEQDADVCLQMQVWPELPFGEKINLHIRVQ